MNNALNPLVSVVIPAFNDERFIAEAIDSVLAQDYPAIEVIVVNDGSTDRTRTIVKSYGERVRLLEQPNRGSAVARNRGIEHASGGYVAFLDADDCWRCDKLTIQVRALQRSGYKMAYSGFVVWKADSGGNYLPAAERIDTTASTASEIATVKSGWLYADLLLDCIVWTSTVMIETTALRQAGLFDATLRKGQDYDLWLRLSRQFPMLGIKLPLALYRQNVASVTHRLTDESFEYRVLSAAVGRWGESAPPNGARPPRGSVRRRLRRSLFYHGLAHYSRGKPSIALESFALALWRHGFALKPFVYLVLALFKCLSRLFDTTSSIAKVPTSIEKKQR